MFESLKKAWRIFTSLEKILMIVVALSPLFVSIITYLVSNYRPEFLQYFIIKNYNFYLILFMYIFIFLIISIIILRLLFGYYKKKFITKPWSFIDTLISLTKIRRFNRKIFLFSLCTLILSFYVVFSSFIYMLANGDLKNFFAIAIFLVSLMLLLMSVQNFYEIFIGLQEETIARKLSFLIILGMFSLQYVYFYLGGIIIQIGSEAKNTILSTIGTYLVPFIGFIISAIVAPSVAKRLNEKRSSIVKERIYEGKGWNRLFNYSGELYLISFSFFFLFFIFFIFQILLLIGYASSTNPGPALGVTFQLMILSYFMIFFISILGFFMPVTRLLTVKLYDWKEFLNVYFGRFNYQLNVLNKLIKTKGKCVAIIPKEQFEDPDIYQQFLMIYGEKNKKIEVIRLKENVPLTKYKRIIREGDEIMIVGKVKKIYDNQHTPQQYNVLFAYHVEKQLD